MSESSLNGLCLNVGLCGETVAAFPFTVVERTTVSLMTVCGSEPLDRGQLAWSVRSPFTGGSYGTIIPLQVGGGEGGEGVQGQAV